MGDNYEELPAQPRVMAGTLIPFLAINSPAEDLPVYSSPYFLPKRIRSCEDGMASNQNIRRMTLRQLLTASEKCTRDLIELFQSGFMNRVGDFRDLSRPVRRRSHYPTMLAMHNSLRKLQEISDQTRAQAEVLHEHLETIREHANRERVNRM